MSEIARPFRIVTRKRWLAEQFAPMSAIQDFGFDIDPATATETLWWAPGAWVASAAKTGVHLPLLSCGPRWLDGLPYIYSGRPVWTTTFGEALRWNGEVRRFPGRFLSKVFIKLPEAKLDSFQARVHIFNEYWSKTLGQYQVPPETLVQLQQPINFITEARFFIAHKRITAYSLYRHEDWIWGCDQPQPYVGDALAQMKRRAATVAKLVDAPPGYVLDMGVTDTGMKLVVEANAAWSSGPYDCDPAGVFEAIVAAHDFDSKYPRWTWQPNPVFDKAGALKVMHDDPKV